MGVLHKNRFENFVNNKELNKTSAERGPASPAQAEWVYAFKRREKLKLKEERRNILTRKGAISKTQVLKTSGMIPSGPSAFLVLSSERVKIASLENIITLGINKLEVSEDGGIAQK